MIYNVLIIGGGAAGYSCALTLSSVENTQEWAKDKHYLLIDNGNSDILKASFFNVPGVDFGIGGDSLLLKMEKQLENFKSTTKIDDTVTKLEKNENIFTITTKNATYQAKAVVIATGMHKFDIECELTTIKEHIDVMKPNKTCLENRNNIISENLYVAGLASGAKTMFSIASGEGSKVACQIFQSYTGKPVVAHDTLKDKLF